MKKNNIILPSVNLDLWLKIYNSLNMVLINHPYLDLKLDKDKKVSSYITLTTLKKASKDWK